MSKSAQVQKSDHNSRVSEEKLLDHLSYYGAFHRDFANQIVHLITVPMLQWSFVVLFRWLGVLYTNEFLSNWNLEIHVGTLIVFFYVGYYIWFGEYVVTASYNVIQIALLMHANRITKENIEYGFWIFVASQIFGWGLQIKIGHLYYEGRNPSFTDSSFDAIMMGPIFTWWEVLFWCGYRPEFYAKLEVEIKKKLAILEKGGSIAPKKHAA